MQLEKKNILNTLHLNAIELIETNYYKPSIYPSTPYFSKNNFMIIAELKIASPLGSLPKFDITKQLKELSQADGMSVLTEPNYFKGSLDLLRLAAVYNLPLLMKDIIISKRQIEASSPASTILLIKHLFTQEKLDHLINFAHELKKEVIVEVDNPNDFKQIQNTNADIIAINNRDLKSMQINKMNAYNILSENSSDLPVFAFSGYDNVKDIINVRDVGASGVLIGSYFTKVSASNFIQRLRLQL